MEKLARLPVFLALAGKRAVVAGATDAAAWKAELLSAAGATVEIFAPAPGDTLTLLAAEPARGAVVVHRRGWHSDDIAGAAIAVAACEDDAEAARFAAACRDAGVPVNVIDKPAHCDFAFGAIVNRSPLVIGISTAGAAPVLGQAIRGRLEALIPAGVARWVEAAHNWRDRVAGSRLSFKGRRLFWQLLTARTLREADRVPGRSDFEECLGSAVAGAERAERGSVVVVGAGPGDPDLLTLRAVRALQSADVILFDELVSQEILDFARREARKMLVGSSGHGSSRAQEEINDLMIELARGGRRVVRLKSGDPTILGRAAEEIAACRAAGIAVEVVPGITAAQDRAHVLIAKRASV
jgi:uroporphyrin-III C-methyltransferase / precorrin-2 dehydrogenase / sirohydrochlorin ferrochelatase